ncbi:TetR/AcrR family transcriptional regulator [Actinopolymorpha singaporensis]|uniref:Regulatory protein, tetR family n=1 Tax=Actinopolymorpha singaporensis TaxID=117157 RepID=A0A1H1NM66_9ACTN|nr:TetR/AcrR family transcriptional regulator [Actinopolymorpha singaporensis]SDS00141.1 regulatory protein, tetR family [Actinopolymorpha singaporensis]
MREATSTRGPGVSSAVHPASAAASDARPSRRELRRREFLADIGDAVRELVVAEGQPAVTMAAVAARLGVTAPALYRYAPQGRTGLLDLGCASVAHEVSAALRDYRASLGPDPLDQAVGICRAFRRWSLDHRAEFALLFAHPAEHLNQLAFRTGAPAGADPDDDAGADKGVEAEVIEAVHDLAWVFEETMLRLWAARSFDVPADETLPAALRTSLTGYRDEVLTRARAAGVAVDSLPVAAISTLLQCWVRVYGLISLETFGHLTHIGGDPEPLFESVLDELTRFAGAAPGRG